MAYWTRVNEEFLRENLCCGYKDSPTRREHPSECKGWDTDTTTELQRVDRVLDYLSRQAQESLRQTLNTKPRLALSVAAVRWIAEDGLLEWRGYISKSGTAIRLLNNNRSLWWDTSQQLDYYSLYVDIDRRIAHSPNHRSPCTIQRQPQCWKGI